MSPKLMPETALANYANARRKELEQEFIKFWEGPLWDAATDLLDITNTYIQIAQTEREYYILSGVGFMAVPSNKMEAAWKLTIPQLVGCLAPLEINNRNWNRPSRFIIELRFRLDELAASLTQNPHQSRCSAPPAARKKRARKVPLAIRKLRQRRKK